MPRKLSDGRSAIQIAPLTAKGAEAVRTAAPVLRALRPASDSIEVRVANHSVVLPTSAFDALLELLDLLSHGSGLRIVPIDEELTTEEAARMLGVSRPHLVKLLEKGELPFTKVGARRRVRAADLARYVELRTEQQRASRAEFDRIAARLRAQLR